MELFLRALRYVRHAFPSEELAHDKEKREQCAVPFSVSVAYGSGAVRQHCRAAIMTAMDAYEQHSAFEGRPAPLPLQPDDGDLLNQTASDSMAGGATSDPAPQEEAKATTTAEGEEAAAEAP